MDNKWKQQFRVLKDFRFWAAIIGWVGMKTSILFFWLLLPILSYDIVNNFNPSMFLSILAGFSTFLSNLISYKVLKFTNQTRRLYFGIASLSCSVSLIGI